jgi:hypothetical protein
MWIEENSGAGTSSSVRGLFAARVALAGVAMKEASLRKTTRCHAPIEQNEHMLAALHGNKCVRHIPPSPQSCCSFSWCGGTNVEHVVQRKTQPRNPRLSMQTRCKRAKEFTSAALIVWLASLHAVSELVRLQRECAVQETQ